MGYTSSIKKLYYVNTVRACIHVMLGRPFNFRLTPAIVNSIQALPKKLPPFG